MEIDPIAKVYLSLTKQWEETSPEVIASNTEKQLTKQYPECKVRSIMYDKLSDMTKSSRHTIYAWLNNSRENIKIPLVKLCMIAVALHTDIEEFLKADDHTEVSKTRRHMSKSNIRKTYDHKDIIVPKGQKEIIQMHAYKLDGMSMNTFINRAIAEAMEWYIQEAEDEEI